MIGHTQPLVLVAALLVAWAPPVAWAEPEADWSTSDPAGDVAMPQGSLPPVPAPPLLMDHVDLRSLEISGEDATGFALTLRVQQLRAANAATCCGNETAAYFIAFAHPEGATYHIRIFASGLRPPEASGAFAVTRINSLFCAANAQGECTTFGVLRVTLDEGEDALHAWIPKSFLFGPALVAENRPAGMPTALHAGDIVRDLRASSSGRGLVCPTQVCPQPPSFGDALPDDGSAPPYIFRADAANSDVVLRFDWTKNLSEVSPVFVERGANTSATFTVVNRGPNKRLIHLSYELVGEAQAVSRYRVGGPGVIVVPANQERDVSAYVEAAADAARDPEVRIVVRAADGASPPARGEVEGGLRPSAALGPANNRLYFHARAEAETDPYSAAFCLVRPGSCDSQYLSHEPNEPGDTPSGKVYLYGTYGTPDSESLYRVWAFTSEAVGRPFLLDPDQATALDLEIASPVDVEGARVSVHLSYGGGLHSVTLLDASVDSPIRTQGTTLHLSDLPRITPNETEVAEGGRFEARVEVHVPNTSPSAPLLYAHGGPYLVRAGTQFRLPLAAGGIAEPLAGPFQVHVLGDSEDYVNPGEARLFKLGILHQGTAAQRLELITRVSPAGWEATLHPGASFQLDPGDALEVALLLRAPVHAQEGDRGHVEVNVTSEGHDWGGLAFRLLVVSTDVPDDSQALQPDPEAQAKLLPGGKARGAPGLQAMAVALAIGLAFAFVRPRRPDAPGRQA